MLNDSLRIMSMRSYIHWASYTFPFHSPFSSQFTKHCPRCREAGEGAGPKRKVASAPQKRLFLQL